MDLAKLVSRYTGPIYLHVINFTDIQLYIYEKCPHDELTIIMRRYMMRIAETIAQKTECLGLITGESIGQVASQTMEAMAVTGAVVDIPIFMPLIGFDKEEIVTIARKIGTMETSILPYEDCCTVFTPRHPAIRPDIEAVREAESVLDIDGLVAEALENQTWVRVKPQ